MDAKNKLCFGDNLKILREYVPDASVDLIYLDPPFNSSATYNVLFKEKSGEESAAQITAFVDPALSCSHPTAGNLKTIRTLATEDLWPNLWVPDRQHRGRVFGAARLVACRLWAMIPFLCKLGLC